MAGDRGLSIAPNKVEETTIARLVKDGDYSLRGRDVRLIGGKGEQHGVVPFAKAIEISKGEGLDLVLVADTANPPVCRVMNYGKFIYEQKKKEKDQRKAHHVQKVKEIKFSANINQHDYDTKLKHAVEFLEEGCKLKATMMFRGREMAHQELGFRIMRQLMKDLENVGVPEAEPRLLGRNIVLNFNPGHGHKS